MNLRLLLIFLLVCIVTASFAQTRKSKKRSQRSEQSVQPTTLDPLPQKDYAPKASRKNSKGPTYESEENYYERMAQLQKTKRKNEVAQLKPQYSDPLYFGHKRPP